MDEAPQIPAANPYESRELLDQYLLFHYGSPEEILPYPDGPTGALGFAERTVTEMLGDGLAGGRALDLGCAVGRSTFELSRCCDEVLGIDFSASFIAIAQRLRDGGVVEYLRLEEGARRTPLRAAPPEGCRPERVAFEVGDATALRDGLGVFDVVHAANLICRLPEPSRLLERLPSLVARGGTLLLTTPCTWLGEFTPPPNWPKGATLDWLEEHLGDDFERRAVRDMPFLIREHARKFQWSVAQASLWSRV